jgi:protein-S-isoprenylcysteine O-methyltransferase Ste14
MHKAEDPQPNVSSPRSSYWIKGGGWVLAQFLVMAGWLVFTPVGHRLTDSVPLRGFAAVLICVGAAAGIAGVRALGQNRTPFPKPRESGQLVCHGIYRFIRHPLYASLIALAFGWACLWRSELGFGLAVVQALLLDAKARREERWLRAKFPEYVGYAKQVARLVPWIY